ncbi:hypothetical protein B484DRAFT_404953 [Ochromonadaceae sp. CCMP2298]|nr:hypothetical protein B484DRAFT_404953 [Ochromonadaceae sp. CCMP2298]
MGSYIIGVVIRCMTKCTGAVDLLARYLPGGTSSTTFQRHMAELRSGVPFSQLDPENSVPRMKQLRPVAQCSVDIFFFGRGAERRPAAAPSDESVFKAAVANLLEDVLDRLRPALRVCCDTGDSYTATRARQTSVRPSTAAQTAARAMQMDALVAAGLPHVIGPQMAADFDHWPDGVEPDFFPKFCSRCLGTFSKSTIRFPQIGCREADPSVTLPTIDEMRKCFGKRDLTMKFRLTSMPLQRVSTGTKLHTVNAAGEVLSTKLGDTVLGVEENVAAELPGRGYFSFPIAAEKETLIFRHTLKSKLANPASNEIKKELLIEAGELLNLRGFTKAGTPHHLLCQMVYDVTDQGATLNGREGRFENWVHLMGHFHEAKMFLECCMDSFRLLGGEHLIACFNCGMSDKQMMRCKSVHIANEFMLECLLPALSTALIRECGADLKLPESEISEGVVLEWANSSNGDLYFASNVYFLLNILIPYAMIKAGIRIKHFQLASCSAPPRAQKNRPRTGSLARPVAPLAGRRVPAANTPFEMSGAPKKWAQAPSIR